MLEEEKVYIFPLMAMFNIVRKESETMTTLLLECTGGHFCPSQEVKRMIEIHLDTLGLVTSYSELDKWLQEYRGLSLQEWVDSL